MTRTTSIAIAAILVSLPVRTHASASPPQAEPPGPRQPPAAGEPTPAETPTSTAAPAPPIEPVDDGLGWDDPPPASQPPATSPAATPPAPVPVDLPPPQTRRQPTPKHVALKRTGTGLLIGAGAVAFGGAVLNGVRSYIVTVPCQTQSQAGCTGGWMLTSAFAWALNITSIPLAATGGAFRGRYAATYDSAAFDRRAPRFIAAGGVMLALGAIANIAIRSVWFYDYLHPEGREIFDFAYPGDALAYYGGLQLSSSLMAAGAGMLAYAGASPFKSKTARRTSFGLSHRGFSLGLRF